MSIYTPGAGAPGAPEAGNTPPPAAGAPGAAAGAAAAESAARAEADARAHAEAEARSRAAAEAREFIGKMLQRAAEKGSMSKEDAAAALARIKMLEDLLKSGQVQRRVGDGAAQAQILRLIRRLQAEREMSVLFITHDFGVVADMASRVVVMSARPGRIKLSREVALPHPRHYSVKTTPAFSALKGELTEAVRAEVMAATAP